jgi:hypothetical protein
MVAAIPAPLGQLPSDSSVGFFPLLGSFQHLASGGVNGERGSQASGGELHSHGVLTEPAPVSAAQQPNGGNSAPATDGSTQDSRPHPRGVNINILLSGGARNNQEPSEGQMPSSALQFLSSLFPGGEILVDGANILGLATTGSSVPEPASSVPNAPPAEEQQQPSAVTEQGLFLSNMLRQIMPVISQHVTPPAEAQSTESVMEQGSINQAENSEAGTSRRRPSDTETSHPNSKRQKTE